MCLRPGCVDRELNKTIVAQESNDGIDSGSSKGDAFCVALVLVLVSQSKPTGEAKTLS